MKQLFLLVIKYRFYLETLTGNNNRKNKNFDTAIHSS